MGTIDQILKRTLPVLMAATLLYGCGGGGGGSDTDTDTGGSTAADLIATWMSTSVTSAQRTLINDSSTYTVISPKCTEKGEWSLTGTTYTRTPTELEGVCYETVGEPYDRMVSLVGDDLILTEPVTGSSFEYVRTVDANMTTSLDWTKQESLGSSFGLFGTASSGTDYVAVGGELSPLSTSNYWEGDFFRSTDTITWTQSGTTATTAMHEVIWAEDYSTYVAVGNGSVFVSPDGVNWTPQYSGGVNFSDVVASPSVIVAVGNDGHVVYSYDAYNWNLVGLHATSADLRAVAWSGSEFVAIAPGGLVITSTNGTFWTLHDTGIITGFNELIWSDVLSKFIATGSNQVATSTDGIAWSVFAREGTYKDIACGPERCVGVGWSGFTAVTTDGVNWSQRMSGTNSILNSVTWTGDRFVAVGLGGTILTAP